MNCEKKDFGFDEDSKIIKKLDRSKKVEEKSPVVGPDCSMVLPDLSAIVSEVQDKSADEIGEPIGPIE